MGAVLLFFLGVDRILNVVPFSVASLRVLPLSPCRALASCRLRTSPFRLPKPRSFLQDLPALVKPGGVAVLVSPYSWLKEYTAPSVRKIEREELPRTEFVGRLTGVACMQYFVWFDARLFRICSSFSDGGYVCFVRRLASALLLFGCRPFFLLVDSSFIGTGKCNLRHRRTQTTSSHRPSQRLNLVVDWGLISGVARRLPGGRRRGRPRRGIC